MAYSDKKQKGEIRDIEPKMYGGTIGGLDLLGGGAVKGFIKGAKGIIGRPFLMSAFKTRFRPPAPQTVTKQKGVFGGTSYGKDVTPKLNSKPKKLPTNADLGIMKPTQSFRGSKDLF